MSETSSEASSEASSATEIETWLEHPVVRELTAKVAELEAKLEQFQSKLGPLSDSLREARQRKEKFLDTVRAQLAAHDNEVRQLEAMKAQMDSELANARHLKSQLQSNITSEIMSLRARAELDSLEAKWQNVMDEFKWTWTQYIRPFQVEAMRFAASAVARDLHGVLIADQMGLGKTLEVEAAIDLLHADDAAMQKIADKLNLDGPLSDSGADPQLYSVLWLCPNSIKETTVREIRKWNSDRLTARMEGGPAQREGMVELAYHNGIVLVCNYESMRRTPAVFAEEYHVNRDGETIIYVPRKWPIVVLDEAHSFKNDDSLTFKWVEAICESAGVVFPMTGTPIMNRPEELWAILHMLTLQGALRGKFAQKWRFINDYCYSWGGGSGFQHGGYERLIRDIGTGKNQMVIRRRKDEVLTELPDKIYEERYVQLEGEQLTLYEQMRDKFFVWLDQTEGSALSAQNILSHLARLRQIALLPAGVKIKHEDGSETQLACWESAKVEAALEVIEELMSNGEKVVVFSTFNEPLKFLAERIAAKNLKMNGHAEDVEVAFIIGEGKWASSEHRAVVQDRFNDPSDNLGVLLGNIRAMGLGLNLQGACSHAIFLDKWWSPGANEQAEDRLHRQGQKNSVTIINIVAERTVDQFIQMKLDTKMDLINAVIERKELRKALDEGLI